MFRFVPTIVASFFLSIHYGTILYINSTLLSNFFRPNFVSALFLTSATLNILFFLFAPSLITRLGKQLLLFVILLITFISSLGLTFGVTGSVVAISFIVYASLLPMIYYYFDIFLEELSLDRNTGEIRGTYLTFVNLGIAIGPFILAGLATVENNLEPIYLTATLMLILPILLSIFFLKSRFQNRHGVYHYSPRLPFGSWWRNLNVRHVTLARFVLESFFAFMVIYTPIYLVSILGFRWSEVGVMFTFMLLPFIFFTWPVGELADRLWGEKEIMLTGFAIMVLSLLVMPFLGKVFLGWMMVLFLSRVGASLIEITTESYFFKQIKASDTALISIFRLTRPVSTIFGSVLGAFAIGLFTFEKIFFVLAVVVLFGFRESLSLKDSL